MRVVGVAALVAAGVAASGFAIQWAALPDAGQGDVVAARASLWLGRYRETASVLEVDGGRLRGVCYHGWIVGRRDRKHRGTLLRLSDGVTLRALPPHTLLFSGTGLFNGTGLFSGTGPKRPVALLYAAGCTKLLSDHLATLAEFSGHRRARRAVLAGVPVYAVDFPHLTLYVDRTSGKPIGVNAFDIKGRFRFVRVTRTAGRTL